MWYLLEGKRSFPNKPTNSREEDDHDETSYEQILREGPEGKVYPPQSGNMNMFYQFVIVFVISMVALFAFAILCLVFVGGTGGWIGFIAASFAILCIASTFIGMNTVKREGGK